MTETGPSRAPAPTSRGDAGRGSGQESGQESSRESGQEPGRESGRVRRLSTYTAGSLIAAGCSELALVVCYGLLDLEPAVSSTIAWLAGAVPNYWLNRSWTWQRKGRPSLRHEVLPYAAIILATLVLAALVTRGVDAWLREAEVSGPTRTVAVAAAFLGVYVIMFAVRYVLLDRLFRGRRR